MCLIIYRNVVNFKSEDRKRIMLQITRWKSWRLSECHNKYGSFNIWNSIHAAIEHRNETLILSTSVWREIYNVGSYDWCESSSADRRKGKKDERKNHFSLLGMNERRKTDDSREQKYNKNKQDTTIVSSTVHINSHANLLFHWNCPTYVLWLILQISEWMTF
jgi:hypothetical protein